METKKRRNRSLNDRLLRLLAADERERMQEDHVRTDAEIEQFVQLPEESSETFSFQRRDRSRVIPQDE